MMGAAGDWPEVKVDSYGAFNDVIERVVKIRPYPVGAPNGPVLGSRYVWRGQGCREWGFHSNLARQFKKLNKRHASEDDLQTMEELIWQEALKWGLDWHPGGGRLSYLELLAKLQHHAAPTRLIDVTDSPHVALWFAVQDSKYRDHDARVFAVDVSQCVPMSRRNTFEPEWPWGTDEVWTSNTPFALWRPPALDPRIDRQLGAFLVGPVPKEDRREHQSLDLLFADLDFIESNHIRKGQAPAHIVIRVSHEAKPGIIKSLERLHGLSAGRLFPDAAGFASFSEQTRRSNPWSDIGPDVTVHHQGGEANLEEREVIKALVSRLSGMEEPAGSFRILWDSYFPVVEVDPQKTSVDFQLVAEVCKKVPEVKNSLVVRRRTLANFSLQNDSYYEKC